MGTKNQNEFALNSKEEVAKFDDHLRTYIDELMSSEMGGDFLNFSLAKYYEKLQDHQNGGRIFSSLLDLKINAALTLKDIFSFLNTDRQTHSKNNPEKRDVLDSTHFFRARMDCHDHLTSFIFRYRAMWDKVMGLMVLITIPDKYESFMQSKSKKKDFKKLAFKHNLASDELLNQFLSMIESFDDKFRTPEAHGTGRLRKWTFWMGPIIETPQADALFYWASINEAMHQLENTLLDSL